MKKTLILDSNNLLYRIFFMNRARGTDVNTLLVFLRCVRSYVDMLDGVDDIIAVWDSKLDRKTKNFRKLATDTDYKGTRDNKSLAEAHVMDEQIQQAVESLGGINMFPVVMEADDVIAWLTHNIKDSSCTVVTVDQDMYQLVNENVSVYSPIKKITVNNHNFNDVVGVDIDNFLSYKALVGDKSDNIPGLPRVGKKTALKYIESGVQESLDNLDTSAKEIYDRNIMLMDLSYGYTHHSGETDSYQEQFTKNKSSAPDKNKLKQICVHNAIYNLANDIDNWFSIFETSNSSTHNVINLIESLNIGK